MHVASCICCDYIDIWHLGVAFCFSVYSEPYCFLQGSVRLYHCLVWAAPQVLLPLTLLYTGHDTAAISLGEPAFTGSQESIRVHLSDIWDHMLYGLFTSRYCILTSFCIILIITANYYNLIFLILMLCFGAVIVSYITAAYYIIASSFTAIF